MIDIGTAVARLKAISFRCHPDILETLLTRHGRGQP